MEVIRIKKSLKAWEEVLKCLKDYDNIFFICEFVKDHYVDIRIHIRVYIICEYLPIALSC